MERRAYYHIKMITIQEAGGTHRFIYFFQPISVLPLKINKLAVSPQGSCLILLCFYRVPNKGIAHSFQFSLSAVKLHLYERENDNCQEMAQSFDFFIFLA